VAASEEVVEALIAVAVAVAAVAAASEEAAAAEVGKAIHIFRP
jgi:hypothetical protein